MNARQTARKFAPSGQMQTIILAIISFINKVIKFVPPYKGGPKCRSKDLGENIRYEKLPWQITYRQKPYRRRRIQICATDFINAN